MTTLQQFLETGTIGSLHLGITPSEATAFLGEPTAESRKKNPLVLSFNALELIFARTGYRALHLHDISLKFTGPAVVLPDRIKLSDVDLNLLRTDQQFADFLKTVGNSLVHRLVEPDKESLTFASGVRVLFQQHQLIEIRMSKRQNVREETSVPPDSREPSEEQIRDMFAEARSASQLGFHRAALIVAWAGVEAVLRRIAHAAGAQGKIGVSPVLLLRELQALHELRPDEFSFLEQTRRLRTETAHGLAPRPISTQLIPELIQLGEVLLERKGARGVAT